MGFGRTLTYGHRGTPIGRAVALRSRHYERARTAFDTRPSLNPRAWRTVSLVRINRTADVGQSGLLGFTTPWRSTIPASWYSSINWRHSCSSQPPVQHPLVAQHAAAHEVQPALQPVHLPHEPLLCIVSP